MAGVKRQEGEMADMTLHTESKCWDAQRRTSGAGNKPGFELN